MDDFKNQIEKIILEEVNCLNQKLKGINFLEFIKFKILEKIKLLSNDHNNTENKNFNHEFKINKEEYTLSAKLVYLDKSSSILKKILIDDSLIISLKEIIKIDLFKSEKSKEISSFSLFPKMGVCLPKKTNINLIFLKNSCYLEILFKNKENIENLNKDAI